MHLHLLNKLNKRVFAALRKISDLKLRPKSTMTLNNLTRCPKRTVYLSSVTI